MNNGLSSIDGKRAWIVEIIRYGSPDLGVHLFGVFDDFDAIAPIMREYNYNRGGKYPAYYVTRVFINDEEVFNHKRERFDI